MVFLLALAFTTQKAIARRGARPPFLFDHPRRESQKFVSTFHSKLFSRGSLGMGGPGNPIQSFSTIPVKTVDGRNTLAGLVNHWKERYKSVIGRVAPLMFHAQLHQHDSRHLDDFTSLVASIWHKRQFKALTWTSHASHSFQKRITLEAYD